ncbi:hypothetical protein DL96DRAFT_1572545, partial [Flagelloscypha sp. PMI_526]
MTSSSMRSRGDPKSNYTLLSWLTPTVMSDQTLPDSKAPNSTPNATKNDDGPSTVTQSFLSTVSNSWPATKIAEMSATKSEPSKASSEGQKAADTTQQETIAGQLQSTITNNWPSAKIATVSRFTSLFKGNQKPITFPPPEWGLPENEVGNSTVEVPSPTQTPQAPQESKADEDKNNSQEEQPAKDSAKDEPAPEPSTIAERIRSIMANMSTLPTKQNDSSSSTTTPPDPPEMEIPKQGPIQLNDPSGSNGPPVSSIVGADSKLMQWLSSETVMNGSLAKGSQSVWSALDSLRQPKKKEDKKEADNSDSSDSEDDSDLEASDESLMVYAPLQPNSGSKVELADTLTVADEASPEHGKPERTPSGSSKTDKKSKKKTKKSKKSKKAPTVWKAHPTQLSIEALWWGYRIYLPPNVVNILDSSHLKAAQRASMITASLKWLFDQIPMMIVPAQFRPGMQMIKSLTPYLGYLGVVITWSWAKIKASDEGNGVVLSATWLIPVALIPSTVSFKNICW